MDAWSGPRPSPDQVQFLQLTTLLVPDRRTIVQSLDVALWKETILVSPISSTKRIYKYRHPMRQNLTFDIFTETHFIWCWR